MLNVPSIERLKRRNVNGLKYDVPSDYLYHLNTNSNSKDILMSKIYKEYKQWLDECEKVAMIDYEAIEACVDLETPLSDEEIDDMRMFKEFLDSWNSNGPGH